MESKTSECRCLCNVCGHQQRILQYHWVVNNTSTHPHSAYTHPFPTLSFQNLLWNVCGKMNLLIHSVTVLSISVCVEVSSNSESFYTAISIKLKESYCGASLVFLCGQNWNQSDPNICFVGEAFLFASFEGLKNAAAFRDWTIYWM